MSKHYFNKFIITLKLMHLYTIIHQWYPNLFICTFTIYIIFLNSFNLFIEWEATKEKMTGKLNLFFCSNFEKKKLHLYEPYIYKIPKA